MKYRGQKVSSEQIDTTYKLRTMIMDPETVKLAQHSDLYVRETFQLLLETQKQVGGSALLDCARLGMIVEFNHDLEQLLERYGAPHVRPSA